MRIKVPFTGTVVGYKPGKRPELDEISGDPNDPVRISVDLGNVSWELINLDIENGLAEVEVTPAEQIDEDTGQVDEGGEPILATRPATEIEKQALLDNAKTIVDGLDKTNRLIRKDI